MEMQDNETHRKKREAKGVRFITDLRKEPSNEGIPRTIRVYEHFLGEYRDVETLHFTILGDNGALGALGEDNHTAAVARGLGLCRNLEGDQLEVRAETLHFAVHGGFRFISEDEVAIRHDGGHLLTEEL